MKEDPVELCMIFPCREAMENVIRSAKAEMALVQLDNMAKDAEKTEEILSLSREEKPEKEKQ